MVTKGRSRNGSVLSTEKRIGTGLKSGISRRRRNTGLHEKGHISRGTAYPSKNRNSTSSMLNRSPDKVLCTLFESPKDIGTRVGLCIINYNTGELVLSDFIDSQIYIRTVHKIHIHQPTEILLPSSSLSPVVSKLATIVKFNVSSTVKIHEMPARNFNFQDGLSSVHEYSIDDDMCSSRMEEIIQKVYAVNASAAAISYTEQITSDSSNNNMVKYKKFRIKYEATENTLLIDPKTIAGLELVENSLDKNGLSFWKFLDATSTKMGRRLLRNNILQPLTDKESIEMRLEAVRVLQSDDELLDRLRSTMRSYQDLDILFAKLLSVNQAAVSPEQTINFAILLKDTLKTTRDIQQILHASNTSSILLSEALQIFSSHSIFEMEDCLKKFINDDCVWASTTLELENQRSYAVKSGANGLLDISRQIYKNVMDEIIEDIEKLSETHQIPLDYGYDSSRGFYLKIKRNEIISVADFPKNFINKVVKKKHVECTDMNIIKANGRLREVMSEISIISQHIVEELMFEIIKDISSLFMISEAISILDLLCCFAYNSRERNYTVPHFSNKMVLQRSRHPILESTIKNFVPNEISNAQNSSSVQVITGCNMSGKSVYLRQIALLCIMAQMGSPVPADYACFKIYTKLHARVCNDSTELCSSNFAFEMKEIACFLDDVDRSTLLILDELGRGSSIGDGFCISLAITEDLIASGCTVFLSTHFQDIPKILRYKPCVTHLNMKTELKNDNSIKMHYKISDDYVELENPGLKIINELFSPPVMKEAHQIAELLSADRLKTTREELQDEGESNLKTVHQVKKIHNVVELLQSYIDGDLDISLESLKALQGEFIRTFED